MSTFDTSPSNFTAPVPAAASVAPITPPMSACEEDDGSPNHHVARFQEIAPIRAPSTTVGVIAPASTIPPAIVAATLSDMKAPAKFRIAAMVTATRGGSAPVAIVVAIEFAVSWKPLVKSKPSAAATTNATITSPAPLAMLFLAVSGDCRRGRPRRDAPSHATTLHHIGHMG